MARPLPLGFSNKAVFMVPPNMGCWWDVKHTVYWVLMSVREMLFLLVGYNILI